MYALYACNGSDMDDAVLDPIQSSSHMQTHTGPLLMQGKVNIIRGAHSLEGAHYCVGFHMSVAMTGPGIPSNGPGCRDGCPYGRFSVHRATLELCQIDHGILGHLSY